MSLVVEQFLKFLEVLILKQKRKLQQKKCAWKLKVIIECDERIIKYFVQGRTQNIYYKDEEDISKYLMNKGQQATNLVKIYDVIEAEDKRSFYVVMEYLQEGTLLDLIQNDKNDIIPKYMHIIAYQICNGIKQLKELDLIHRDLKPENIFVKKAETYIFKIGDFGLSKKIEYEEKTLKIKRCNSLVGTVNYMAPEMTSKNYTDKIDVWSFGCILFELIKKSLLFPCFQQRDKTFLLIQSFRSYERQNQGNFIDEIMEKCLVPEANKRSSIEQVFIFIENFLRGTQKNELNLLTNQSCQADSTLEKFPSLLEKQEDLQSQVNSSQLEKTDTIFQDQKMTHLDFDISNQTKKYSQLPNYQTLLDETMDLIKQNIKISSPIRMSRIMIHDQVSYIKIKEQIINETIFQQTEEYCKTLVHQSDLENLSEIFKQNYQYENSIIKINKVNNFSLISEMYTQQIMKSIKYSSDFTIFNGKVKQQLFKNLVLSTKLSSEEAEIPKMFCFKRNKKDNAVIDSRTKEIKFNNLSIECHFLLQAILQVIFQEDYLEQTLLYLLQMASKLTVGVFEKFSKYSRLSNLFYLLLKRLKSTHNQQSSSERQNYLIEGLKQGLMVQGIIYEFNEFAQSQFKVSKPILGIQFLKIQKDEYSESYLEKEILKTKQVLQIPEDKKVLSVIFYYLENDNKEGGIFILSKQAQLMFLKNSPKIKNSAITSVIE